MDRYEFSAIERGALERLNIAMAIYQYIDERVVTLLVTDGMCSFVGLDREATINLLDRDMYKDTHPEDRARVAEAALKFAMGGTSFDCVYRTKSSVIDEYVIIHSHGEEYITPEGTRILVTIYMVEGRGTGDENPLTEKLANRYKNLMTKETLIRNNFFDPLTGLPNMSYFLQLAEAGKRQIEKNGKVPAVLFVDLIGMKYFNEKYGIREGDNLLIATSELLKKYFSSENCGRMGSDHYGVFTELDGLEDILNAMFEEMKDVNEGRTLPIHVGIYSMEFESVSVSSAFDRAKLASDEDKGNYTSKFAYYDDHIHTAATNYIYVINNFEKAMEERWIMPYYQQIIRSVNGLVCDEEALARWIDPVKGLIPPDHFIYVLEDMKLIHILDLYILDRVIENLEELQKQELPLVPISINLSKYDFQLCDMVEEIKKRVEASEISPDKITIEITESVSSLDPDFVSEQIRRFHDAGFKVWMDDFGSGYSSLNMLQMFEFDVIKFDMRFMREFSSSKKNHVIIKHLIQMAKKLGIDTVVEGVETIDQVKFLREIGATKLQGYFFSKPIDRQTWYELYGSDVGNQIEDERETCYYEAISKINVIEPDVNTEYNWRANEFFGQLPTGILEFREETIYVARYNKTFANFLIKTEFIYEEDLGQVMIQQRRLPEREFFDVITKCVDSGKWELAEGIKERGMTMDLFIKFIGRNPITDYIAFEVVIIAISSN